MTVLSVSLAKSDCEVNEKGQGALLWLLLKSESISSNTLKRDDRKQS